MTGSEPICDLPLLGDPHHFFDRLRTLGALVWHETTEGWFTTSYALASRLLLDHRLSAASELRLDKVPHGQPRELLLEVDGFFNDWMVFSDSPRQIAMRRTVARAYSPHVVKAWRLSLERLCAQCLDRVDASDDMIEGFAVPFALAALRLFLGLHEVSTSRLRTWSDDLMAFLTTQDSHLAAAAVARRAIVDMRSFVQDELRSASRDPSASPQLRVFAELSDEDALSFLAQVVTGSIDPITSCIGTLVGAIFSPACAVPQYLVTGDSERIVEEALRLEAPFHFSPRTALVDLEVEGGRIQAGDRIFVSLVAANRDPAVFERPADFILDRKAPPHLSFGLGRHYCLGAAVARMVLGEVTSGLCGWSGRRDIHRVEAVRAASFGSTKWSNVTLHTS